MNSEDLLQEELKAFTWDDVDTYPTFKDCESITDKARSKTCFQNTLTQHVIAYLDAQHLVVTENVNDTVSIDLEINKSGKLRIEGITMAQHTKSQLPELDSLLRKSFSKMPKVLPAIKRGQEVTSVYKLPVVIEIR